MESLQASSYFVPLVFSASTLAAIGLPWLIRIPRLSIATLALSLVCGQLIRLPFPGQGGGLIVSDVAVVIVLFAAAVQQLWTRQYMRNQTGRYYTLLYVICSIWFLFMLSLNRLNLGAQEVFISALYWARLTAYALLLPALIVLIERDTSLNEYIRKIFLLSIVAITLLGITQMAIAPKLSGEGGWDPHQNRLVGTWLDPNFMGAFLSVGVFICLSMYHAGPQSKKRIMLVVIFTVAIALLLTQSRSSFVALALTTLLCLPIIAARVRYNISMYSILLGIALGILLLVPPIYLLQDRILGLFMHDATVSLRASALMQAWHLATERPLVGVGYNAYQFAASQAGLIQDFTIHSRAGTDNSLLTLMVTAGLIGVVLFLLPWILLAQALLRSWIDARNPFAAATIASILFICIHSQFINSFLYPHILLTLSFISTIALTHEV